MSFILDVELNLVTCSNIPHHFETALMHQSEIVLSDVDENADYKMLVDYHKFYDDNCDYTDIDEYKYAQCSS